MGLESGLLGSTRVAHDLPVACPAGLPIAERAAGAGCRCRITATDLLSATDPSSLEAFCLSPQGYRSCPVWRHEKDAIAAGRPEMAETR